MLISVKLIGKVQGFYLWIKEKKEGVPDAGWKLEFRGWRFGWRYERTLAPVWLLDARCVIPDIRDLASGIRYLGSSPLSTTYHQR